MPTTYAIPDGRVAMAATLYTGTGANRSVSNAVNGVGFQPDWVWMKARSAANSHYLANSVMGVGFGLISDSTGAQQTVTAGKDLTSFDAAGFSLGPEQSFGSSNTNGTSIVAWQWKAGGTAVSNTAGSITSSVSANTTAGFSVVTYTGNGISGATVGHGLGVTPGMTITKIRSTTGYWSVWHNKLTSYAYELYLNTADAQQLDNAYTATPSSTVITMNNGAINNSSGATYVTYCFAPVAGYSAFGSYTGNGSTDGVFVYLGFRARWLLIKETGNANSWELFDTSRDPYNISSQRLFPNDSAAEVTTASLDILSNGIKFRVGNTGINRSGGTYIYMAFAENPTKFANAR